MSESDAASAAAGPSREFTIILPTTKDRGPLLPLIVGRMQLQSVYNWELFIIGDGVNDETRTTIQALCAGDARIRFFDHPKHPRRGEPYRHEALAFAKGVNVAYSCDRDLWLPDHLERLGEALLRADWAHTRALDIRWGTCVLSINCNLEDSRQRRDLVTRDCSIPLSCVGHTLAAYRGLPFGWRETPIELKTDRYMWVQFLSESNVKACSVQWPTVLYFNRGNHPGWPTKQRHEELAEWVRRLPDAASLTAFRSDEIARLQRLRPVLRQAWRSWCWRRPGVAALIQPMTRQANRALNVLGLRF